MHKCCKYACCFVATSTKLYQHSPTVHLRPGFHRQILDYVRIKPDFNKDI